MIFIVFWCFSQKKKLLKIKINPDKWQKKSKKMVVGKNSHLENAIIFYDEAISIFKNLKPKSKFLEIENWKLGERLTKKNWKIGKISILQQIFGRPIC